MKQYWTALANTNLGLTVDKHRTKEEPFQTASKADKTVPIASVLLVVHIIGWQRLTMTLYMSVAKV